LHTIADVILKALLNCKIPAFRVKEGASVSLVRPTKNSVPIYALLHGTAHVPISHRCKLGVENLSTSSEQRVHHQQYKRFFATDTASDSRMKVRTQKLKPLLAKKEAKILSKSISLSLKLKLFCYRIREDSKNWKSSEGLC
jgi:hypothetical protein